jgi:S1-C subfamily serine protease
MHHQRILFRAVCLLLAVSTPSARSDEVAEKGRDIFAKHRHAVVTVQVVLKATASGGRSAEFKHDITGTVIDPSGLTVTALSSCDPYELRRRVTPDFKVDSEVSDVKLLLDDGTDLPAEVVLRDRELDLAFVRPKGKPANPMTAIDLARSGPAQVLDEIVALNRLNRVASRAYAVSVERITAVVQKPRTFYIPDSTKTATSPGSPAFSLDGKIIGVFVVRAMSGAGDSPDNPVTSIILPAEDILKGAKQAPEARGDSGKTEERKAAKEAKEDTAPK